MTPEQALDRWGRGWRGPFFAALVALIAGLPGIFAVPTLDRDEARFAEATAQMLETRDFVTIKFQDEARNKKPVGIHWLQALSVMTLSHPEDRAIWAYRIPSLLGAMLAAAACAWGAAAFVRRDLAALAGAALGATFMLSTEALFAKTDGVLCGAVTLSMAALARIYLSSRGGSPAGPAVKMLFWVGMALGLLVKGPVGPMVVGLTVLALCVWDRKAAWLRNLGWGWGLILVAAVVGPWAMAITVATDGAFWGAALGGDLAPKLVGGQERHGGLPGYYTLLAPLLVFPATVVLPAALMAGLRYRTEPAVRFALCWLIPTWIVFEIAPTKLPHYTLPTYGALAWLMARALAEPLGPRVRRWGAVLSLLNGGLIAAIGFAAMWKLADWSPLPWAVVVAALYIGAGLAGAVLILRQAPGRALMLAGALGIAGHGVLAAGLAPAVKPFWLSERAARVLTRGGANPRGGMTPGPVTVAGYAEPSIVFELGADTDLTDHGADAAEAIGEGRPAIVEQSQEAAFRAALAASGARAGLIGTVEGLDYSKGRHDILRVYRPLPTPAKEGGAP